jgi:hypothetical protein
MIGTTTRLRSFNVVQLGLMYGIICAVIGVILGLIFGLLVGLGGNALSAFSPGMPSVGPLAIILFPILYGIGLFIAGFIEGLIIGAVYNLVAGWIGGVEVQLETLV